MVTKEQLALTVIAVNDVISGLNRIKNLLANYQPPKPLPPPQQPKYKERLASAKYINVSATTLYRLTKKGLIQSYAVGGKVMYKTSELDNFITSNQKKWKA